jgi:hypothetical protein
MEPSSASFVVIRSMPHVPTLAMGDLGCLLQALPDQLWYLSYVSVDLAASAYARAAECFLAYGSKHDAATNFNQAGQAMRKINVDGP